uniref:Uncharacterized protein n=1 Tax=Haptolina ericina TaxID=156174 RepID=A0A7S3EY36_9EUKA|mmetsp:Transcript_29699/g.67237  ORF Transcript_29699/g.67237 Transcript_29699/m.67237 type:complete len:101 (+) Transcript_29699:130-432(+)
MSLQNQSLSVSASNQKARVLALFDQFRASTPERTEQWPTPLLDLVRQNSQCSCLLSLCPCQRSLVACSCGTGGSKNPSKHLQMGTVLDYIGDAMNSRNCG